MSITVYFSRPWNGRVYHIRNANDDFAWCGFRPKWTTVRPAAWPTNVNMASPEQWHGKTCVKCEELRVQGELRKQPIHVWTEGCITPDKGKTYKAELGIPCAVLEHARKLFGQSPVEGTKWKLCARQGKGPVHIVRGTVHLRPTLIITSQQKRRTKKCST